MLPHSHDEPAGLVEASVGVGIALPISLDLRRPVPAVHVVPTAAMIGAAVPEAPVHKHRDPRLGEYYVGLAPQGRERLNMNPVTQSCTVEDPSEGEFWTCVLTALRAHSVVDGIARSERLSPRLGHAS